MTIERVGVVGAGQMGAGIAEVSLRAGVDVRIYEPTEALAEAGRGRIVASLDRGVSRGKLTEAERNEALARLSVATDIADLADRQLVVEAIVEDATVKATVFAQLDEAITDPDAVLASNTSSIPIMKIAAATKNPEPRARAALLQPGAGAAARRVGSDAGHHRRGAGPGRTVRGRDARQEGGALHRPLGLRRQRAAGALPAVGDPDGRGGRGDGRGHRHRRRRRAVAPDGPAAAVRPRRAWTR